MVELSRFLYTGAQINTVCQVRDSIMSVAAGFRRWASFCDFVNCPPAYFHPVAINVPKLIALVNPGRTFSLSLYHLGKACHLINVPPSRYTTAVRGVARGMENARDFSLKYENYIRKKLTRELVGRKSPKAASGRLFY